MSHLIYDDRAIKVTGLHAHNRVRFLFDEVGKTGHIDLSSMHTLRDVAGVHLGAWSFTFSGDTLTSPSCLAASVCV